MNWLSAVVQHSSKVWLSLLDMKQAQLCPYNIHAHLASIEIIDIAEQSCTLQLNVGLAILCLAASICM